LAPTFDRIHAQIGDQLRVKQIQVFDLLGGLQAQQSLADANDAYIGSLYSYNVAKISLARAIGFAESNYSLYLKGQ